MSDYDDSRAQTMIPPQYLRMVYVETVSADCSDKYYTSYAKKSIVSGLLLNNPHVK